MVEITLTYLRTFLGDIRALKNKDFDALNKLLRKLEVFLREVFGNNTHYLLEIQKIEFSPHSFDPFKDSLIETFDDIKDENWHWEKGCNELIAQLEKIITDINLSTEINNFKKELSKNSLLPTKEQGVKDEKSSLQTGKKVFIVHGHNEEIKQAVLNVILTLKLTPIILSEMANLGSTVIEKFNSYSDVDFAVVILSADDFGYSKKENSKNKKLRARQNAVLELGFFIAKLGRERVFPLHEKCNDFEVPSDINGLVYYTYEVNGNWKLGLAKELLSAGIEVDANIFISQ